MAREVVGLECAAPSAESHAVVLDGGDRVARAQRDPGDRRVVARSSTSRAPTRWSAAASTTARRAPRRMNCQGQHVFLVGGGNSAGQAAMFFANYARKVTLLVRGPRSRASMSHYLIQQLATKANIEICTRCRIVRVDGEHHLEAIVVEHRDTGELRHRARVRRVRLHRRRRPDRLAAARR